MKSKYGALVIFLTAIFSVSCSNAGTPPASSTAGSLTTNTAFESSSMRPFGRHTLNGAGGNYLNEFIRPEVRARLDEEPTGDTDGGYDPGTSSEQAAPEDQTQPESGAEAQAEDPQQQHQPSETEDGYPAGSRLDTLKYSWAKKEFGSAVNGNPTNTGVIVLYADENYYDTERLIGFVEGGRNRIAELSGLGTDRIQVVFGGYRAVPQVELWVVPQGQPMPEFKTDERPKSTGQEN